MLDEDRLVGQDPDQIISVTVSPNAAVLAVTVDRDWTRAVDPRGLHSNVLAAANAATMVARSPDRRRPAESACLTRLRRESIRIG